MTCCVIGVESQLNVSHDFCCFHAAGVLFKCEKLLATKIHLTDLEYLFNLSTFHFAYSVIYTVYRFKNRFVSNS